MFSFKNITYIVVLALLYMSSLNASYNTPNIDAPIKHIPGFTLLTDINNSSITSMAFSTDGTKLCACYQNGIVKLFNVETRNLINKQDCGNPIYRVKLSPDSNHIVVNLLNEFIGICKSPELESMHYLPNAQSEINFGNVDCIEFNQDGSLFAICTPYLPEKKHSTVSVFVKSPENTNFFYHAGYEVPLSDNIKKCKKIAFSSDGVFMAANCIPNNPNECERIQFYDLSTCKLVNEIPIRAQLQYISFLPNGTLIAMGTTNQKIKIFTIKMDKDGTRVKKDSIPKSYNSSFNNIHNNYFFTSDYKFIFEHVQNKTLSIINIYKIQESKLVRSLQFINGECLSCTNQQNNLIAFGFSGKTIIINPINWRLTADLWSK